MTIEDDLERSRKIVVLIAGLLEGEKDTVALTSMVMMIAFIREQTPDIAKYDSALYAGLDYVMGVK